jgi:hypothetical protein
MPEAGYQGASARLAVSGKRELFLARRPIPITRVRPTYAPPSPGAAGTLATAEAFPHRSRRGSAEARSYGATAAVDPATISAPGHGGLVVLLAVAAEPQGGQLIKFRGGGGGGRLSFLGCTLVHAGPSAVKAVSPAWLASP